MRSPSCLLASVCLALACLSSTSTHAQDLPSSNTLPIERFRPTIDNQGLGITEGGSVPEHLGIQGGLVLNYALNPLVLRDPDGVVVAAIVAHRVGANAQFTIGLFDYASLGVDLPLTLAQLGGDVPDQLRQASGVAQGLAGIGVGDLRLVPKIRVLREEEYGVSLAIIPSITLPTAGGLRFVPDFAYDYGGSFLGEGPGAFAFIPEVVASFNLAGLRPAANVAYRLRQPTKYLGNLTISPEFVYRFGLGYDVGTLKNAPELFVFGELFGATADSNPFGLFTPAGLSDAELFVRQQETRLQNPLEWLVGLRWKSTIPGFTLEGGVGSGLRAGYGSPDLRVSLGARFAIEDEDVDDDGVPNKVDACRLVPEDKDGYEDADGCPDPDNDGDGIPDTADSCPIEAEDVDSFGDDDGCPDPDNDGDGILDPDDMCRDVAGSKAYDGCLPPDRDGDGIGDDVDACPDEAGIAAKNGCKEDDADHDGIKDVDDLCPEVVGTADFKGCADSDHDGVADPDDKCPGEAEVINGVDDGDGCPDKGKTKVIVTSEQVEIKETVYFDTGKDTIQSKSFPLLDQVALVLKAHPEIKKARVEGHTDSDGDDDKNLDLSKRRAAAVLKYLVDHGVDASRLESEGYGETRPIADNKSKKGKAKNRRVEFVIVEQG